MLFLIRLFVKRIFCFGSYVIVLFVVWFVLRWSSCILSLLRWSVRFFLKVIVG